MKIKKHDARINIKLPSDLKTNAEEILAKQGYSLSAFIREKLEEIVKAATEK